MGINVRTPGHVFAVWPGLGAKTRGRKQFLTVRLQDQVAMTKHIFLLGVAGLQERKWHGRVFAPISQIPAQLEHRELDPA